MMENIKVPEKYKGHFKYESDGFWLYKGCILPGVSNLFFGGFACAIFMLLSFNVQAVWLCEVLRGKVKLPNWRGMNDEIDARKTLMHESAAMLPNSWIAGHLHSTLQFVE